MIESFAVRAVNRARSSSMSKAGEDSPLLPRVHETRVPPPPPATTPMITPRSYVKRRKSLEHRRLNSTQLFDLYRRLDVDGNGELDLTEFLKVAQLLNLDDEHGSRTDHLAKVFQAADTESNGFLTAKEFSTAYELILAHKGKALTKSIVTFVEAIRYGRIGEQYFVTIYTGTVDNINTFQSVLPRSAPMAYSGTLGSIVDMVEDDSTRNASETSRQNILWWIDLSCSERSVSLIREIRTIFGLPEESETIYLTNNLTIQDKSRFMTGLGSRKGKVVHSMALCVETMWLKNRPVVDMYPPIVHKLSKKSIVRSMYEYIVPRLSIIFSYKKRPDYEREVVLMASESAAKSICSKYYEPMPVGDDTTIAAQAACDFLLSNSDIRDRGVPKYEYDVVAFHLLKYSAGKTNCLLSFRCFDDDGDKVPAQTQTFMSQGRSRVFNGSATSSRDLIEPRVRAHRGIVGRLLTSMRAKIIEVMDFCGVSFDGQLADSSAQLLAGLIHVIHDFTVTSSLSPIQNWMSCLDKDLQFAAMTKHDRHVREIRRLLADVTHYVRPFGHILESHILKESAVEKRRVDTVFESFEDHVHLDNPDNEVTRKTSKSRSRSASDTGSTKDGDFKIDKQPERTEVAALARRAESVFDIEDDEERMKEFEDIQNLLYPNAASRPKNSDFIAHRKVVFKSGAILRELRLVASESFKDLLYGNTLLMKKGITDWLRMLKQYEDELDNLSLIHTKQLEEQRTSFLFILTIFQVLSWPITFMTGYWGMNFDNMPELKEGSYPIPFFGGYKLMWFAAACVYALVLAFVLHSKIMFSAS